MQNEGVAVGSSLGPVLANIFVVVLERTILSRSNKTLETLRGRHNYFC